MYDHVLVPVSFDDDRNATQSLEIARKMVSASGRITLLHVMEQIPSYAVNYVPEGFHDNAKVAIAASMDAMAGDIGNAESVVVEGHSGRTILDWAEENGPDLIVIASHRPGLQDYFLGSTASQVVRHAQCSVHVLR
ncbi:universal stress protein [uncultured Shimia sp.]|uniref:universal stress protein n=1 Tax=uncultured Shimia sp. TaxID=573152 RepID=UPI002619239C|nr:universal stress protein [uncultured Shimia sp.]